MENHQWNIGSTSNDAAMASGMPLNQPPFIVPTLRASPGFRNLPSGDVFPADLAPYLAQGGKPVKIAAVAPTVRSLELFAARFPENFDISDLAPPLIIERDLQQVDPEEEEETTQGRGNMRSRAPPKLTPIEKLPWRITDQKKKSLIGRKVDLDASTYFISLETDDAIELLPLSSWYVFQTDMTPTAENAASSCDIAERKRRAALKSDEKASARFWGRLGKSDGSAGSEDIPGFDRQAKRDDSYIYAEDAGLKFQQKKKVKSLIKQKNSTFRTDDEDPGNSALNIKAIKRAEVDWDFEDDGIASDDEDEVGAEAENTNLAGVQYDSSDEEDLPLSKFGQQVNCALENQKEQDMEDELAQFSDDDEEKTGDAASGSDVQSGLNVGGSDAGTAPLRSDSSVSGSRVSGAARPTNKRAAPGTGRSEASNAVKPGGVPDILKQRVIRVMLQNGGRMQTKSFLDSFKITSNKSELFQQLRRCITEICDVHSEQAGDKVVKFLELRPQFRPS